MYGLIELSAGRPTKRAILVAAAIALSVLAFAASPAMAADGTGSIAVTPTYVIAGSSGNEMTFVYTGGAGGVSNGNITITVPSGWSAPTFSSTSAAGFTSDECGADTDATSGQTIELEGVFVSAGSSCDVIYGNTFEGPGATAPPTPATAANDTFTTKESSTSSGTLTALANGSPGVTVGADGTGTMTVSPGHVVASSTTNKLTFTYTATQTMTAGELTITLPAGWSAPSATSGTAGYTTTTCPGGTVVGSGQEIKVTGVNLSSTGSCTVVYGAGSAATAQSSGGGAPVTFTTQQEATNDNDLVAVPKPPSLIVTAGDGAGAMTVSPTDVIQSSTGNQLTFTYTAPPGGLSNGEITLTVPSGWSPPSTTESAAGFFEDEDCAEGSDVLSGRTIEMEGVYLDGGDTCQLIYGDKFGGPGATAPPSEGATTFTTQEQSYSTGTLTNLAPASQPVVDVGSDGTGTMTLSPTHAVAGSSGNTLTFTYTAGVAMTSGEVTIALPSGWSAPSGTVGTAGYTTTTCTGGSAQGSGQTIEVSGISISSGTQCTITYGNKTGGGPGATASPSGGSPATLTVQEKSSSSGTLTTLGTTAPTLLVTAPDGSGTMTVSPTTAITSSTGNTLTFTYTAPSGGLNNGDIDIAVPSGWSPPSFSNTSAAGFTSDECGANTDATSGQTIELQGVFLDGGDSCQIIYGNKFEGPGATATPTSGPSTFTTSEQSYTTGTLMNLPTADQPTVTVGADGLGTMTVTPTTVVAGSTGNTLSFQYTAASNISSGEITIAVPAGWTQPTTTTTAAGAVFSSCAGTLQVSGSTIEFSDFNLSSGGACTITYGYKTDGGSGVTAPPTGGPGAPYTFTSQEKSSSGGTLTTLGSGSPSVIVVAADGTGSMAVSPTNALNGSAQEYTFTYTAPSGGLDNGELTIAVPLGWSAPQLGSPNAAGYVLDDCGQSTAIASGTIQSSGVSLEGDGTCQIIYGVGAAAAVAPSTSGSYTFTSKEKSTAGGTLGGISSPAVDVDEDGVGTLSVAPLAISAGTSGSTLTFTYTAPGAVGLSGGEVTIAIPAGWPAPSTTQSAAGFTSTTCSGATVQASASEIDVSGISIAESSNCTIVYGDRGSGGPGLTVPSNTGAVQFSGTERSSTSGTLTALGSPAQLTVYAGDGSGTMTASPTFTTPGSDGNTLTFTYTAAGGGLSNGGLTLAVPAGWSAPSTTGGVDGYTSSTCGNVAINGTTVEVTSVSLASGDTCKIVYGDTSKGGAGATAPPSAGISSFATEESSTASGTPTGIGSSPQVALLSADGSGTLSAAPTSLQSGSSGNTLTFTYTAASGGTQSGEITLAVPTGYPLPSTTGSDPGFTSSDCGTVGVSGATIQITGVTVAGGSTCTIVYGSKASGGPGLTAPSQVSSSTFTAQEASSGSGTLKGIASSPGVTTATFPVLTVTVSGSGTVTGAGLSCPGACSKSFAPGTSVTLTATPASGFKLSAWGGACSGNGACSVTVSAAKSVSATFVKKTSPPPPPAPKCVVPKLKGDSLSKAKSLLAKAHCSLGKVTKPKLKKHHKAPKLVVGSTSPGAGSKRADHAKVAIKLVAAPKKKKK